MDGYALSDPRLPKGALANGVKMIRRQLQDLTR